ncbi:hypothetical protein RhiirA4_461486 [Rhizophagus irregularis]|nr:hypothetical protein RhiirA4_461486 [Rhizophagus irregularis]
MAVYNEGSIDIAISTNSYDELIIGLCQGFLSSKQSIDSEQQIDLQNITNPVISTREGRLPSRAKRNLLSNIDNIQPSSEELQPNREKDTRKQCQKCSQRGHNRVTCKLLLVM